MTSTSDELGTADEPRTTDALSTQSITVGSLPRTLWDLASTELWERFSFFGLQAILPFYLLYSLADGGLDIGAAASAGIVGAYGGAAYLAQLGGAWLGERVISPKWAVFWGGVAITAGHVLLAFISGVAGLAIGLILIVLGTGALKTNITSIVGFTFDGGSAARRDVGFSYLYLAISAGAVVGPLATGFAQNEWGFHWGFGLAAIGMALALVQYVVAMRRLPQRANTIERPLERGKLARIGITALAIAAVVVALFATGIVPIANLSGILTVTVLLAAALYFFFILRAKRITSDERSRVWAFLPMFLAAGFFFSLIFQQSTSIAILLTERVDLNVLGWDVPPAWVTMLSPLAIVIATPIIASFWGRSGRRGPGAPKQFAIGLAQIGVAYVIMLVTVLLASDATVPLLIVALVMLVAGSSEVFVGPIGQSLSSRIGPKGFRLQLIALNFLTLALGTSLSGVLGQLFAVLPLPVYFGLISGIALIFAAVLFAMRGTLERGLTRGLD